MTKISETRVSTILFRIENLIEELYANDYPDDQAIEDLTNLRDIFCDLSGSFDELVTILKEDKEATIVVDDQQRKDRELASLKTFYGLY